MRLGKLDMETTYVADCESCGGVHPAEFSHLSQWGGAEVFAVVCPVDYLTDYYTAPHGVRAVAR